MTQTKKKGLESKQKLIEEIRDSVDKYARIFIFSIENMRNAKLKDVRQEWKHSRFFFGKNKVMSLALGSTKENEYRDNLHKVSRKLSGQMGLLFTNKTKEDVLEWFKDFSDPDYARSGNKATQTVILEEGPVPFTHSMEPQLRQLGLPTSLQKGIITLMREHKVCEKGDTLTPEQCRILKLFGHMLADFFVEVNSMWSNDGTFDTFTSKQPEHIRPAKVKLKARKPNDEETAGVTEIESDDENEDPEEAMEGEDSDISDIE